MSFPVLEVAGLGANLVGSLMQAAEARKRFRAMKMAAQRVEQRRNADSAMASAELRGGLADYESSPGRASLRSMWESRLANPNVVSDADLSVAKQGALSEAGSESAGAITAVREQAQRSGLGGSRMSLGVETGIRGRAFGKAAGISTGLDMEARKANRASQDATREGYANYLNDDEQVRGGYRRAIANLLGSRQYDESSMLAMV